MAYSPSLLILNTMVSWRSIWCNSFLQYVCWDPMYFEIMIRSMFLSMKVIWVFWSRICMITYSLIFLLQIFGLVRPTRSIFLAMGRGALWWVRSYGAQSQWQKGTWHVCIIAIKDNKMGSISTEIDPICHKAQTTRNGTLPGRFSLYCHTTNICLWHCRPI